MEEDPNQERKQKFLREKILEKGVDTGKFVDFLKSKKGEEEGADIGSWTMEEIKQVVKEFYQNNNIPFDESLDEEESIDTNEIKNNTNNDNSPNQNNNDKESDKKLESVNKTDDLDKNKNEKKTKEKKPEKEESIKFIIDEDSLLDFMLGFKGIKRKNKGDENKNSDMPKSSPLFSNNSQKNNNFNSSNNQQFNFQNNFSQNINNTTGNNSSNNEKFNFEQNFNKNNNNNNASNQQFNFDKNFSNNQSSKDNNSHDFNFDKNLIVNKNSDNKTQFNFDERFKDNNSNINQKQSENSMNKNEEFNPNENKKDDPINNNIKDKEIKSNDSNINNSMGSSNDKNNNDNSPNNISKNNLTNMIDKNDHDSEYGITIPEITKCKKIETTEFSSHKDIVIKLSNPVKVETRFFTGKSVNYLVTTAPFNYAVHRKYSDFLWLRDTLSNIFNTNLIPKITKKGKVTTDKHDDLFIQKRMKILEKFINFLVKDELIKSSKIFYDFLTLQKDEDFQHVKKGYDKMKISPFIDVKERKSLDGEIKVKILKEKEIYFENIKDNAIYNGNLLKKLNNNFKLLQDEFDAVVKRFDSISQVYRQLYDVSKNYLDQKTITEGYSQMDIMFDNLSKNFNSMKKFINSEIREYFKFIGNNFNCISEMAQNVDLCKSNYLKVSKNLINKKNDLFRRGDISKWELSPEDKQHSQSLLKDKTLACIKMLPKETKNCISSKEIYGFYLNRLISEFERIRQINSISHKKNIVSYCQQQIMIFSEYTKILGDITMTMDSCSNKSK